MASSRKPRATRAGNVTAAVTQRAKGAENERPFDLWLQKQLHAMYDEIAGEPLPNDLLDLIDNDAAKKEPDGEASPGTKKP